MPENGAPEKIGNLEGNPERIIPLQVGNRSFLIVKFAKEIKFLEFFVTDGAFEIIVSIPWSGGYPSLIDIHPSGLVLIPSSVGVDGVATPEDFQRDDFYLVDVISKEVFQLPFDSENYFFRDTRSGRPFLAVGSSYGEQKNYRNALDEFEGLANFNLASTDDLELPYFGHAGDCLEKLIARGTPIAITEEWASTLGYVEQLYCTIGYNAVLVKSFIGTSAGGDLAYNVYILPDLVPQDEEGEFSWHKPPIFSVQVKTNAAGEDFYGSSALLALGHEAHLYNPSFNDDRLEEPPTFVRKIPQKIEFVALTGQYTAVIVLEPTATGSTKELIQSNWSNVNSYNQFEIPYAPRVPSLSEHMQPNEMGISAICLRTSTSFADSEMHADGGVFLETVIKQGSFSEATFILGPQVEILRLPSEAFNNSNCGQVWPDRNLAAFRTDTTLNLFTMNGEFLVSTPIMESEDFSFIPGNSNSEVAIIISNQDRIRVITKNIADGVWSTDIISSGEDRFEFFSGNIDSPSGKRSISSTYYNKIYNLQLYSLESRMLWRDLGVIEWMSPNAFWVGERIVGVGSNGSNTVTILSTLSSAVSAATRTLSSHCSFKDDDPSSSSCWAN